MKTVHDFELPPELLKQAIVNTINGLTMADATQPDLPLVYVNPGFTHMTGYSADEVLGQNCRFLQGDDRDQPDLAELRAAIREGRACTVTLRNYRKDGTLFWNELTLSPLHDAQGKLTHFVGIQQDITPRKRLEQQIRDTLERREYEVYTAIEVAQDIAAAPALEDLFRQVVELIQERFGYYYAHVYTLDGEALVMQEGTGEAGRQMKATGHQIALTANQSLVARAARESRPVLIADVAQAPDWLPNALLPDTRSELAVPIVLRDAVLGVLDVQSDAIGGLTEEDQLLLIGLCGQIAVAIEHRRTETERQQAEAALRTSEARLAEALAVAQLGHWELDVDTLMFTFNDQFYALMGTTAEQEGGYQMPAARYAEKFIPPEEMHVVAEGTQAAMETTDPNYLRELEHRIIRGDGTEGYLHVRVRIVKDEHGQTIRIYGANQDITERKLVELERERLLAEMQESERLTRTIIDSTPDWIFIKDQNHLYRMVNRGYANSFHMEPEEFIGKNDLDIGFPEAIVKGDPEQGIRGFWADDRQVMDSGETKFVPSEPAVVDGEARTLSTIKVPLRDDSGAVWGVLGYVRDITENMRVQEQLKTSQTQLSEALDIAQMAYWEFDFESTILSVDDKFYSILGTTPEQEGGYDLPIELFIQKFIHPDDADVIPTEIQQALQQTDPDYEGQLEYRLVRPNDQLGYAIVRYKLIRDEQGQTVKAYGTFHDVTERWQAEVEHKRVFALIGATPDLVALANAEGQTIYLNQAGRKMMGFGADEDLSKISMVEYCSDWAAELLVNKGIPTALREGTWSSEMALLTRSGREIPGSQVLIAQIDAEGKPEFFGTIIRDISERKLAEAEMEENLRELQRVQQALSHGGWQTLEETLSLPDGYIFDRAAVQPANKLWTPELRLAAERKVLVPPLRASEPNPEDDQESKVAVAPLLVHDETIGAIGVYEDPERPLSSDELALVKGVSEQVALALESARLFEESQRNSQLLSKRVRELNCMNDVGREIEKAPPIPQLLQWVTERIPAAMQFPDLCVVAIRFEDQVYGVTDALDLPSQMVNGLYMGGEIRGRIYIAYTEKHDFLNEESALLGGIATRLSGYIENRYLFEQTRRRAEQERLINTITQKIQSTTTVEKALQTAVQELGQTFQARYTRVEIKTNGEGKHHQTASNGPDGTDKPK